MFLVTCLHLLAGLKEIELVQGASHNSDSPTSMLQMYHVVTHFLLM